MNYRSSRSSRSQSVSSYPDTPNSQQHSQFDSPAPDTDEHLLHPNPDGDQGDDLEGLDPNAPESALLYDALSALHILKRGGSSSGVPLPSVQPHAQTQPQEYHHHPSEDSAFPPPRPRLYPDTSRSHSIGSTHSSSIGDPSPWGEASAATTSTEASSLSEEPHHSHLEADQEDPNFMSRVSQLPIVSGGYELYQRGKNSSRVVKYGAGLVESSISAVSRPITSQLGPLDDFACRQLDRFTPASSPSSNSRTISIDHNNNHNSQSTVACNNNPNHYHDGMVRTTEGQREEEEDVSMTDARRSESPAEEGGGTVAVASRSKWQTVLLEAGGLGAAVSEESLKSLRYCLQWLLYATAHLDHQIGVLHAFINSLHRDGGASRNNALVTASASAHLTQVKHDIVETIRKVVDVVSKYAGAALPEQAKRYVRQSILGLPMKWAAALESHYGLQQQQQQRRREGSRASGASTPTNAESSGRGSERMDSTNQGSEEASTSATSSSAAAESEGVYPPTEDAAERVLTFAVESLDMLRSVTQIFSESVEKAEAWVGRLRIVGVDRQRQRREGLISSPAADSYDAPLHDHHTAAGTKRRRPVAESAFASGSTSGNGHASGLAPEAGETDSDDGVVRRKRGARSRDATMST